MKKRKYLRDSFYINSETFSNVTINTIDTLIGGPWIHYVKHEDGWKLSVLTSSPVSEHFIEGEEILFSISASGSSFFNAEIAYFNINTDPLTAEWNDGPSQDYNNFLNIDTSFFFIKIKIIIIKRRFAVPSLSPPYTF